MCAGNMNTVWLDVYREQEERLDVYEEKGQRLDVYTEIAIHALT